MMEKRWLVCVIVLATVLLFSSCTKPPAPMPASPLKPPTIPTPPLGPPVPAPVPTPATVEKGVVFISDFAYRDRNNYLHVIGEVRNDTTGNVRDVKITVSLLDGQGNPVATRTNLSYLTLLDPGQRSPFDIIFPEVLGGVPNYQMELSWEATNETDRTRIEVRQISTRKDEKGYYWVEGEVRNAGSQAAEVVAIVGTFYDDGKVVAVAFGLPDTVPLAPGNSSPFSLPVEIPSGMTIQKAVVQAETY